MSAFIVPRRGALFGAVVGVGALGLVLLKGLQAERLAEGRGEVVAVGLVLLAVVGASVPWWRALDEAAREAHKSAAYWGCLVALVAIGCLALNAATVAHMGFPSVAGLCIHPGAQAAGVAAGAVLSALLFAGCYGAAWVVWWARRR